MNTLDFSGLVSISRAGFIYKTLESKKNIFFFKKKIQYALKQVHGSGTFVLVTKASHQLSKQTTRGA